MEFGFWGYHDVGRGGVGVALLWVELLSWVRAVTVLGERSLDSICIGNIVLTSRSSFYWDGWSGQRSAKGWTMKVQRAWVLEREQRIVIQRERTLALIQRTYAKQ